MPLPELTEAKGPEEDWTGLKDAKQRKKLQNRLNVRAHRKRKACLAAAATCSTEGGLAATLSAPSNLFDFICQVQSYYPTATKPSGPSMPPLQSLAHIGIPGQLFQYISSLARRGESKYQYRLPQQDSTRISGIMFPLSRDHLLPLVQYNIMRAAVTNMTILAIDCHSDMCSAFWSSLEPYSAPKALPNTLAPTPLQLAMPHQRWIDLLPHPCMRDNAILAQDRFNPAELEEDLFGEVCSEESQLPCEDAGEMRGLLVWTDPWRPEGWEVTEGFVCKWGFLLRGCDSMFCATNRWRANRGEMPLVINMEKA
ncbi:hypothetical protein N431DRAFT_398490 [Stipitochalara longipes BDJ]|nr:hypothetical protein N431DRAFT_398490 [Stipitochalara longipes BDJ]